MDSEGLCAIAGRRTFQCRLEILHRLCIQEQGYTSLAHADVLVDGPGSLWILKDSVLKAASGDEGWKLWDLCRECTTGFRDRRSSYVSGQAYLSPLYPNLTIDQITAMIVRVCGWFRGTQEATSRVINEFGNVYIVFSFMERGVQGRRLKQ